MTAPSLSLFAFVKQYGTSVSYGERHLLAQPDQSVDHVWYVLAGSVRQYAISDKGTEVTVNTYKEGALITLPILFGGMSAYFLEAAFGTELYMISREKMLRFLAEHPAVALEMLERLSRGLDGALARIAVHSQHDARMRVQLELDIEAKRFGEKHSDRAISVTLAINDLVAKTGLARETVSRVLALLEEEGVILHRGKTITLLDPKSISIL